ncbi:MAG: hypothetical protein WBA12_00075 [Catalinimonas sp.]
MSHPAIAANISNFCRTTFVDVDPDQMQRLVQNGQLYEVAQQIRQNCFALFDNLMAHLLPAARELIAR